MTKHDSRPQIQFPKDFLWGCATSAYQIEGSPLADGAGPSVWHRFSHTPGRVQDGDTGDVTCDHYRRYESDVDLMQYAGHELVSLQHRLGPRAARGHRARQRRRPGFLRALVDRLLSRGIQPMVTLFHWDLPAALDDRGGWLNRDIADWFAEYADIVYRALRRSRQVLDHVERALGGGGRRLHARDIGAGSSQCVRSAAGRASSHDGAWRSGAGLSRHGAATRSAWW